MTSNKSSLKELERIHDSLWRQSHELKSLKTLFTGIGSFQCDSSDLIGVGLTLERIQLGLEQAYTRIEAISEQHDEEDVKVSEIRK